MINSVSPHCFDVYLSHHIEFSDIQIKELISRDAVIGVALDAWMIIPNWKRGISKPYEKKLNINSVINHIDHICQLAGNSNHVGIGSDLDGAFGKEQCPYDINSIADIQKFNRKLEVRGYLSHIHISQPTRQDAITYAVFC